MLTTPWNSVLKALGVLRVPDVFVVILGMTFRYILFASAYDQRHVPVAQEPHRWPVEHADERRLIAASAGILLLQSLHLSSEVYLAMQSRGLRRLSAHDGYLQDACVGLGVGRGDASYHSTSHLAGPVTLWAARVRGQFGKQFSV